MGGFEGDFSGAVEGGEEWLSLRGGDTDTERSGADGVMIWVVVF